MRISIGSRFCVLLNEQNIRIKDETLKQKSIIHPPKLDHPWLHFLYLCRFSSWKIELGTRAFLFVVVCFYKRSLIVRHGNILLITP